MCDMPWSQLMCCCLGGEDKWTGPLACLAGLGTPLSGSLAKVPAPQFVAAALLCLLHEKPVPAETLPGKHGASTSTTHIIECAQSRFRDKTSKPSNVSNSNLGYAQKSVRHQAACHSHAVGCKAHDNMPILQWLQPDVRFSGDTIET